LIQKWASKLSVLVCLQGLDPAEVVRIVEQVRLEMGKDEITCKVAIAAKKRIQGRPEQVRDSS
jgi:hypothetical protein